MEPHSCRHSEVVALTDLILLAALDGTPIPTNAIDQLTPWRARLVVRCALRAGAPLEHGDPDTFDDASRQAGWQDAGQVGWWRAALGLPPREQLPPPAPQGEYRPPAGWRLVSDGRPR